MDVYQTNARQAAGFDRRRRSCFRELLASYLEPEGYAIVIVSLGIAAIEEARRLLPDLVVTDVLMPGAGGLQTLFVLKNTPETSEIPGTVVSGISPRILDPMPAAAYLVMPVDRQTFVQTVRNCRRHLLANSSVSKLAEIDVPSEGFGVHSLCFR